MKNLRGSNVWLLFLCIVWSPCDVSVAVEPPETEEVAVEIRFRPPSGFEEGVRGTLELRAGGTAERRVLDVSGPSRVVSLAGGSRWEICPQIEELWAPCREVVALSAGEDVQVEAVQLWPAGRIAGRFVLADEGSAMPKDARLWLRPAFGKRAGDWPETTIRCPVEESGAWSCRVPRGRIDLGARPRGFVNHYFWDLGIGAEAPRRLGDLVLEAGASLVGWVEVEGGEVGEVGEATRATLSPLNAPGGGSLVADRLHQMEMLAPVQDNGFFQFDGVPPGTYLLEVTRPGFAPGKAFPLEIWPQAETALGRPVTLRRPVDLELEIAPPTDWLGAPWRVRVLRVSDHSSALEAGSGFIGVAGLNGSVSVENQAPGSFSVRVSDSQGNAFHVDPDLRVEGTGTVRERIDIDLTMVEGRVVLGGEPLLATLWFGGRRGGLKSEMQSDLDGRFAGVLPRDGWWRVEIEADDPVLRTTQRVEVASDDSGDADVLIELPDTEVFGTVSDESGGPVDGARVSLATPTGTAAVRTDRRGEYVLRAFRAGPVSLHASARGPAGPRTSDGVVLSVVEGVPFGPVGLTLVSTTVARGTVVGPEGRPIQGATVDVTSSRPVTAAFRDSVRTDERGRFQARIRRGVEQLQIVVSPPGHALTAMAVPARGELAIAIPRSGGVLEISTPEPDPAEAEFAPTLLAFYEGLRIPMPTLYRWTRGQAMPWFREDVVRIPQLAPGKYRVCLGRSDALGGAALEAGDWTRGLEPCAEGFLAPGAVLSLDLHDDPR